MYGLEKENFSPTEIRFTKISGAKLLGSFYVDANSVPIKEVVDIDENNKVTTIYYKGEVVFYQKVKVIDKSQFTITGTVHFSACDDQSCRAPKNEKFSFGEDEEAVSADSSKIGFIIEPVKLSSLGKVDYWKPVIDEIKALETNSSSKITEEKVSYWLIFLGGFLGGLLALFTPCVWPIIPMTVSFFLKRNKDKSKGRKEALFYGLSINVIYVTLGVFVTLIFGASALNQLSTNAVFNLVFTAMLIIFAVSFLGYFEITLPSSWSTALNNKAESTSGILSILLMASVLVVVSFSCTGPIIGTLLVEVSTTNSLLAPVIGMFGFSLALSIPFSIFALFPTWLNSMPRSGSWMNVIKVVLAFIEMAFALKFFSVADMSYGWNLLTRNLFIGIWIAIALFLGLYLFGLIRFPHDSKSHTIGWPRRVLGLVAFMFIAYLSCGFWGAPLKEISAFLPPEKMKNEFLDYEAGMKYAAKNNLPVFVDFTGYGCVNCRKMEGSVMKDPKVQKLLSQFVVISLYVDDKKNLPKPETFYSNGKKLLMETYGDKWSYLEMSKFGIASQPYYVTLDNDGYPLSYPFLGYKEDVDAYVNFLQSALDKYNY
jgi:thiol:disulfide interchange protein DsbD